MKNEKGHKIDQMDASEFRSLMKEVQLRADMSSKHPRSSSNDDASPSKKQKELETNKVFVSVQQNCQTVVGDQLVQFLQDTLVSHGLCFGKAITACFKLTQNTYRINVRSSRQAEFLCWFNGLTLKNGQNSAPLTFDRGDRWKGPKPKYQSYAEFVEHEGRPMQITKEVAAPNSKSIAKCVAFLFYFPSCRSIKQTVSFLNQVMEEEGLVHKSIDRAIVAYHFDRQKRYWVLEMANEDVQEKIRWLHSLPWSDFGTIKIGAGGRDGKPRLERPRYTSWAAYKANGDIAAVTVFLRNPPITDTKDVVFFLNKRMREYGLLPKGQLAVLRFRQITDNALKLEVATPEMREKIMYLRGMGGWNDPAYRAQLQPHSQYKGPTPKYRCFSEFWGDLEKSRQAAPQENTASSSSNKEAAKSPPTPETLPVIVPVSNYAGQESQSTGEHEVETPPSQTPANDDATAIREENERLKKELVKLVQNNDSLKGQLSTKADKETDLQACVNKITTELATTRQQLHDVHQSWQEQVHEISEKDGQISFMTNSIDALQKHVQTATESLAIESHALAEYQRQVSNFKKQEAINAAPFKLQSAKAENVAKK
jgi:hypothetical protein